MVLIYALDLGFTIAELFGLLALTGFSAAAFQLLWFGLGERALQPQFIRTTTPLLLLPPWVLFIVLRQAIIHWHSCRYWRLVAVWVVPNSMYGAISMSLRIKLWGGIWQSPQVSVALVLS